MNLPEVYIVRTATFLPNNPISNDEMEDYLGKINEQASKSRRIVLRNNKITNRFYAMQKDGTPTHTNSEMAALSIRNLFANRPDELKEVDLLSCATSSPDQLMPSHAVMVHGWLPESGNIEVVSPAGVCCAGMHAFKYAYMSLKLGQATKAIASGSERLSASLLSDVFELEIQKMSELEENPILAFDKDFLRWMLSDGAGSFLMQNTPNEEGLSLKIDWIEGFSFANEKEACMYMGADKLENGELKSYLDFSPEELNEKSIFSIKQDVKLLGSNIYQLGTKKLKEIFERHGINSSDVDHFLPHISSYFFQDKMHDSFLEAGLDIPLEKWFTNLSTKGNVGAASIYMILDELFNSGQLKKGETIVLGVPESARFSYVYAQLTVC